MESFRESVLERVKRPVAWFNDNIKDKVATSCTTNNRSATTSAPQTENSCKNSDDKKTKTITAGAQVNNNRADYSSYRQATNSRAAGVNNARSRPTLSSSDSDADSDSSSYDHFEQLTLEVSGSGREKTEKIPSHNMSVSHDPVEESLEGGKGQCHQTAKRRLAYQKSYSLEHGANWRRRSLIEDARFDTVTNAEFERHERASLSDDGGNDNVFPTVVENGCEHAPESADNQTKVAVLTHRKCTLIFSVRDMNALSRVFKTFENSRTVVQHVESRKSRKKGSAFEFLINFEAGKDDLQTLIVALKSSSAVTDVVIVSEKDAVDEPAPWIPRHISDLDNCTHLLTKFDPDLDHDHPGFADQTYRERRKEIAEMAFEYRAGQPIQTVEYQIHEIQTWGTVYSMLQKIYPKYACKEQLRNIRLLERECGYSPQHIPQLEDVSNFLKKRTGFQLRPVAGLLSARDFLASLAFRVFQCTQYIRHSSKPDHTVEPDCVHELLGHVPMLADPTFAQFSQEIGLASLGVSDADIEKFATVYWFTVEFGLCKQDGQIKAYGAGLLSAFGELNHAMSDVPEKRPFEPEKAAIQPYDDQAYQDVYYVANSFDDMKEKFRQWSSKVKRPYQVRYDPFTQSIQILNSANAVKEVTRVLKAELNSLHNALDKIEGELQSQLFFLGLKTMSYRKLYRKPLEALDQVVDV